MPIILPRFIFVTGGVVSSLGKGIAASALAALLIASGFRVRMRKLDPYLNVDPGTMSPTQHGEVYVTDDGAETDLDLGHYERFTGVETRQSDNVTTGKIYAGVIARERRGDYLGATVQVIPHVTDAIKEFIRADIGDEEFCICEIGGTVGDIESLPFLEAIRQLRNELGRARTLFMHVTLLPWIASAGELKTKPTQHSVKELLSVGIQPDILLCRADRDIPENEKRKIALFCNVAPERVVEALDVSTIYAVPGHYHAAGLDSEVLSFFNLSPRRQPDLAPWHNIVRNLHDPEGEVTIAIVGKYTSLPDSYKSLHEAIVHGGIANRIAVNVRWIDSELFEREDVSEHLQDVNAILVPGGFGERGTGGKIEAIRFARERKIPFLGICFGMQMAVIEAARNIGNVVDATSSEFGPGGTPLVGLMTEWHRGSEVLSRSHDGDLGGTMRLGGYVCNLKDGSLARKVYGGVASIRERHRHRYEVNIGLRDTIEKSGVIISGISPDGMLPEIIERNDHPWFIGVQFHPELTSRPFSPHPLFSAFIAAAIAQSRLV